MKTLPLILTLAVAASACRTIEPWEGGYPRKAAQLPTDAAKRAELDKFSIYDGSLENTRPHVQLNADRGTDRYYDLGTFRPVVSAVSPKAVEHLEQARTVRNWGYVATTAMLVGIFLPAGDSRRAQNGRNVLFFGGLASTLGLSFWSSGIFEDMRSDYNHDLNRRIYGDQAAAPAKSYLFPVSFAF